MKYIEFKSEGYAYRYDFEPTPSTSETFNPNIIVPDSIKSILKKRKLLVL